MLLTPPMDSENTGRWKFTQLVLCVIWGIASCSTCPTKDVGVEHADALGEIATSRCVGGTIIIVAVANLGAVDLPNLERAGGLYIYSNPTLKSVRFPRLLRSGTVEVGGNSALQQIDLPALASTANTVRFNDNPELKHIDLPALESVGAGGLAVRSHQNLKGIRAPNLVNVGYEDGDGTLDVVDNPNLVSIETPRLERVTRGIGIDSNNSLSDLQMKAVVDTPVIQIRHNPSLPQCRLDQLESRWRSQGLRGQTELSGGPGSCN